MSYNPVTPGALKMIGVRLKVIALAAFGRVAPRYARQCYYSDSAGASKVLYAALGNMPVMREFVGQADIKEATFTGWEVPNKPFHNTFGIKEEDLDNNTLAGYTLQLQIAGNDAAMYPDKLRCAKLMAGFTSKCYTGKNFYDTDHKHFPGGNVTFDNKLEEPLTHDSYNTAWEMLAGVMQEDGVTPFNTELVLELVVGPKNRAAGQAILEALLINGGDTNTNAKSATLVVDPLITDESWHLLNLAGETRPLLFQEAVKTQTNIAMDKNSPHWLLHHEAIFQLFRRCNVEYLFRNARWVPLLAVVLHHGTREED